ncbi:hypothetical protein ACS0TY_028679 [Phlomoides rotata]
MHGSGGAGARRLRLGVVGFAGLALHSPGDGRWVRCGGCGSLDAAAVTAVRLDRGRRWIEDGGAGAADRGRRRWSRIEDRGGAHTRRRRQRRIWTAVLRRQTATIRSDSGEVTNRRRRR